MLRPHILLKVLGKARTYCITAKKQKEGSGSAFIVHSCRPSSAALTLGDRSKRVRAGPDIQNAMLRDEQINSRVDGTNLGGLLFLILLGPSLLLRLQDGSSTSSSADLSGLVSPCSDGGKVGTNNTTLVLYSPPCALLGNLFSKTLLVHATVHDGPCDLARVLALLEQRFRF